MSSRKIRTGRVEAAVSYIRYFLTTFSSLIILPVILSRVSDQEYGLWGVFISIEAFVALADSGIGSVVTRYVTYAFGGAKSINNDGLPELTDKGEPNDKLLFEIIYTAKRIYVKVALVALAMLAAATGYIYYLSLALPSRTEVFIAWGLFSVGCAIKLYFTFYSSFAKGIGKIKECEFVHIITTIVYIITRWIFISLGYGLIGLALASLIDVLLNRILIYYVLRGYMKMCPEELEYGKSRVKNGENKGTLSAIWNNSKQMGLATISDYITGQGKTLLCSIIVPLSLTGCFSLTNQLINAVASIALIPFNTFRVKLGDHIVKREKEGAKYVFSFILFFAVVVIALGGLAILTIGEPLLQLFKSNTSLLNWKYIIVLVVYQLIISSNKICTYSISLNNRQPFIKSYVISSIAPVVATFLVYLIVRDYGLIIYIAFTLISQLVYNAWKWPTQALKLLNLNIAKVPSYGIKYAIKVIKGKN